VSILKRASANMLMGKGLRDVELKVCQNRSSCFRVYLNLLELVVLARNDWKNFLKIFVAILKPSGLNAVNVIIPKEIPTFPLTSAKLKIIGFIQKKKRCCC